MYKWCYVVEHFFCHLKRFRRLAWRKVQRLITGTPLARGRRTVTAALRHTGQGDTPAFSLYHQMLNRARWSALKGSRCLLALLVQTFDAAGGSLTFVLAETLEHRWSRRINKRGIWAISSHPMKWDMFRRRLVPIGGTRKVWRPFCKIALVCVT